MASLVCNSGAYTLYGSQSLNSYAFPAATGSYSLTGTDIAFGRGFVAGLGSYAITGVGTTFLRLAAFATGYQIQGTNATLIRESGSPVFAVDSGAYTLSGTAATVRHSVPSEKGAYTYTGIAADLLYSAISGRLVQAVAGSYSLTGGTPGLVSTVAIGTGDYSVTGTAVTFRFGFNFIAASRAFTITSPAALLEQTRTLPLAGSSYTYTGFDVHLAYSADLDKVLPLQGGAYSLTGIPSTFLLDRTLVCASGSYTLTGVQTSFTTTTDVGVYALQGTVAQLSHIRTVIAEAGTYTLTGQSAFIFRPIATVVAESAHYTLSGLSTLILHTPFFPAQQGRYTYTGIDAFLRVPHIWLDSGGYALSGGTTNLTWARRRRWKTQAAATVSSTTQDGTTTVWDPETASTGA